jgi:DNA-binding response OmpR family regulator
VGRLELDLRTREVRVGSTRALLSEREFQLLGYLVEHAGEAVSRERLLSDVWGYGFDPGSNVVEVCVRRIRRRLRPESPIETVRTVGYRIASD